LRSDFQFALTWKDNLEASLGLILKPVYHDGALDFLGPGMSQTGTGNKKLENDFPLAIPSKVNLKGFGLLELDSPSIGCTLMYFALRYIGIRIPSPSRASPGPSDAMGTISFVYTRLAKWSRPKALETGGYFRRGPKFDFRSSFHRNDDDCFYYYKK